VAISGSESQHRATSDGMIRRNVAPPRKTALFFKPDKSPAIWRSEMACMTTLDIRAEQPYRNIHLRLE
jgi:hypothetical protein